VASPRASFNVTRGLGGGGIRSRTSTLNELWLELPCASDAVHLTAVIPSLNEEPDAGLHALVTGPTASVAVGGV